MKKTVLRIRTWPDPVLRKKCRQVKKVDSKTGYLLDKMHYLMKRGDGVGLAANQAGLDLALVVIEAEDRLFKLVNPRIIKKEGRQVFEEGCLSFPGLNLTINRAMRVWVSALDDKGDPLDIEAEGVLAVIFQHEIDHINGVVFIDRVPFWRKLLLKPSLRRIAGK